MDPSSKPLHRQVYDAIREAVLGGQLRPGDRLPATRMLADQLSLSRTTIAEAYEQLQAEGYILGRHGSGTYVAPNLSGKALQVARSHCKNSQQEARLSRWGRQLVTPEYQQVFRSDATSSYPFDFRPHQVAHASFPWDAWRWATERVLAGGGADTLSHPSAAGHPELLEAISDHVGKYRAVSCTPEQIVVVNGSQEGLNLLAQLLLDRGDAVAMEDPGYSPARLSLEAAGLIVTRVPVDEDGLLVERLAECSPQRLVHVTPSHQYPTGATLSVARRLALLDLAEQTGFFVVEDDYDSEFRYEGRPVESLQGLDRSGQVIYAGTFSKSLLAGLRIGYLILPQHLIEPVVAAKSLWDSGTPMLEQAILAQFMRSGEYERHIRRMRRLYRARRDALLAALHDSFGATSIPGTCHGGLSMLVAFDLPLREEDIFQRAEGAGIGLRTASAYYSHPPERPTFLLGFGAQPEEDIRRGIALLASTLQSRGARETNVSS